MMRIGLVTGEYPPMQGGVGAYTHILAHTLAAQGHDIFVLSSVQANEDGDRIKSSPVIQHWSVASLRTVHRWAAENRLDILNLQYQTAAYSMSAWIHFIPDFVRSVPVVTTFHDLRFPYLFPKAGKLRNWIVMHLAYASDGVIATNHEDMQRLNHLPCAALVPIGSNILTTLASDFDTEAWRTKAGVSKDELLLAFFGLVNHSKGLDVLIQALAKLRNSDVPARMVIIGGVAGSSDPTNAAYQHEIESLTNRLELTPYIYTTGFLEEEAVGKFLVASDVVVLPFRDGASYRRGSLMAAVRYGCAIITTQPTVDIPNFTDGENMLLVPAENTQALVEAIIQLYQSPQRREKLRQGANRLANQFEWSQIAQNTAAFFERFIGAKA